MRVTVERIAGRLVAESPGISAMYVEADLDSRLAVITCPACGKRTVRYLVERDEFDVRHLPDCGLEQAIARFVATHPELVGRCYTVIAFPRCSR